jgi:8-oxo-dGTP pyrophosphatase MutT (NUDIX family)
VSDWLYRARQAASADPLRPRATLFLAAANAAYRIGSVEPGAAERMIAAGLPLRAGKAGYGIEPQGDAALAAIARWLHQKGIASHWRGELLAVVDADTGRPVGSVERGVVRALGLTTSAVHLAGRTSQGRFWVQQRAFDKATDPGRWDTTVGGQMAAGESIAATLERETMEEAGLAVADLRELIRGEPVAIRGPVADGYMVEHIEVYRALVPAGLEPVNRDGEVERFECLDEGELVARLAAGNFTLEATLILGAELERRA